MTDSLLLLKEENKRLSQLAEKDWLTGLCNRMAAEKRINDWLKTRKAGTLFVLDVDNFKSINDRYGHIAGDKVLQGIADILTLISFSTDIIGRVGGDEFIVFMPASQKPDFIEVRCQQMKQQFSELTRSGFIVHGLSISICGSSYQKGDDYQCLFDRADQCLLREKSHRKNRQAAKTGETLFLSGTGGLKIDMKQIRQELSEPEQALGAFCQDYDNFVSIYRFVERRLQRVQSSVYSILFTLMDEQGDFPPLQERCRLMEMLHECIQLSLRSGDVFTRYSSCQFLVMVSDVTNTETNTIAERIRESFGHCLAVTMQPYRLTFNQYPLKPAFSKNCCS